jgi:alkanesulfonate monooxygenase SsuD/methylene tetrahydromethanopterin reductase-like flavin-dependent oxidoreductase (luciferase family)
MSAKKKMSDEEISERFDKQMKKLEKIAKKEAEAEARENNTNPDDLLDQIDDFFEKGKDEFEDIDKTETEDNVISKYSKIKNRHINVRRAIIKSEESVLDEIKNWKKEGNLVAKSLLRMTNWILKSEKSDD